MRTKTVELIVEEAPWIPGPARHVFVDVKYEETRLRTAMSLKTNPEKLLSLETKKHPSAETSPRFPL
jgi:hypothetical protein